MPRMSFRRRIRGARITDGKRPLHVREEDAEKAPVEANEEVKEEKKSNNRRKR